MTSKFKLQTTTIAKNNKNQDDYLILTESEFYEMALPQMSAKRYNEMHAFAEACKNKGWPIEKTCNALGVTIDDLPIIATIYQKNRQPFSIFPDDYSDDDIEWEDAHLKFKKTLKFN